MYPLLELPLLSLSLLSLFFFIGRIINIVSILGRIAAPLRSPYCTVKFGVEAFSDCLRLEMRRWGVDVIVVEPGDYTTGERNIYVIHVLTYTETWLGQLLKQMITGKMKRVYIRSKGFFLYCDVQTDSETYPCSCQLGFFLQVKHGQSIKLIAHPPSCDGMKNVSLPVWFT